MTNQPHNTQELDVNKLERIIADHNKEMRRDMASEITGGTRSKSVTDVVTVKALLGWHNKQTLELLDRFSHIITGSDDFRTEPGVSLDLTIGQIRAIRLVIEVERNKLKEVK